MNPIYTKAYNYKYKMPFVMGFVCHFYDTATLQPLILTYVVTFEIL